MNLNLQFFGIGILAVGIWSWSEKDRFSDLSRIAHIALDPAFMLIVLGIFSIYNLINTWKFSLLIIMDKEFFD